MKLLLDTHVLLWWLADSRKLSRPARRAISESESVYVSAATAWEISIKTSLGKLSAPSDLREALAASRMIPLDITLDHAVAAGRLPRHHDDPFDRMLIAQAMLESLTLLTVDHRLRAYPARVLAG